MKPSFTGRCQWMPITMDDAPIPYRPLPNNSNGIPRNQIQPFYHISHYIIRSYFCSVTMISRRLLSTTHSRLLHFQRLSSQPSLSLSLFTSRRHWTSSTNATTNATTTNTTETLGILPVPVERPWTNSIDHSILWIPRQGTGFDHFIPKHKQQQQQSSTEEHSNGTNNNKNDNNNNNNNNNNNGPEQMLQSLALMAFLVLAYQQFKNNNRNNNDNTINTNDNDIYNNNSNNNNQQPQLFKGDVSWNELAALLQDQQVDKIVVAADKQSARVYEKSSSHIIHNNGGKPSIYTHSIGSVDAFERKVEEVQVGTHRRDLVPIQYLTDHALSTALLQILPSMLIVGVVFYFSRQFIKSAGAGGGAGGIFQIGKSTAKKINKQDIDITFADVAGCHEAKKEIMEFVDFLMEPEQFTKLGAKIPKGALLCGPPGTGKTLLAKAVAGEAGVPFYSVSGSDFIEMFVGVGPSRVRDLFKEARANAPCIIFIDEIDAVGRQRGRGGVGGNDERENTLNQLLVEMDGFETTTGVVVLAGTNRVDILDQALTRPGRFDRQIQVDRPDLQGRKEIFKVHLKGIHLQDDVEDIAGRLAGLTPGFAGADIANICNEAAIVAARRKGESVSFNDFEKATDRIVGGLESNKIMSKEERSIVAHHEAGHAIAGWFLEHASPLLKVTIIPRSSGALGYAQYLPRETFLRTHDQIMDIVCMALAGRASEEIFFGRVTTGASDDLKKVTEMVYNMIQIYGMNTRLGQLAFPKDPNAMFEERPYSDATANAMDEEAKRIVDQAYQRTLSLLLERKEELTKVAELLLAKETITHDDVIDSIGARPFASDSQYDDYIMKRRPSSVDETIVVA